MCEERRDGGEGGLKDRGMVGREVESLKCKTWDGVISFERVGRGSVDYRARSHAIFGRLDIVSLLRCLCAQTVFCGPPLVCCTLYTEWCVASAGPHSQTVPPASAWCSQPDTSSLQERKGVETG